MIKLTPLERAEARIAELEADITLLNMCFYLAVEELLVNNPEACPLHKPIEKPFQLQYPCNRGCASCWYDHLWRQAKEEVTMSERGINQTKPSDDVIIKNLMARVAELAAENQRLEKALRLAWAKYDDNDFCDDSCGDNHGEVEDCYQCWYDYLLRQAEGGDNE